MGSAADREPIEILITPSIEEIVQGEQICAIGRSGEIQQAPVPVSLQLLAARIAENEHGIQFRVELSREAIDQHSLTFFCGELEVVFGTSGGAAIQSRSNRYNACALGELLPSLSIISI